ncbi:MAG: ABC transporter permease [Acidobacteriota bacterium]
MIQRFLEAIGRTILRLLEETGRFFIMLGRIVFWAPRPPYDVREHFKQMQRVGVNSIPVVFLTMLFTGMVLALQAFNGFARFNAQSLVGSVVTLSLMRELSPVLSVLMVTGRVGSSMAAEIGSMRVTEQIDALEALATEPVQYLFVPRVIASIIMMPLLVVMGDVVGMLGGYFVAVKLLGTNPVSYYDSQFQYVDMIDFTSGIIKAAVFGLIFSVVACVRGFYTEGGAEGVGRSTTQAVVVASLTILFVDFFLTRLLY